MFETNVISELQDLTYLNWSKIRNSSGTAGSFLKAYSNIGGKKVYYKLSNYDNINGVIGFENVNEIIVDRLLTILGIDHLHYQLIHAKIKVDEKILETYICASIDFKEINEDKVPLDIFYEVEHKDMEDKLSFIERMGFIEYVYKMFVVDFLILNRDRHGANIEVLRNRKDHTIKLAPLFDHGLSLLFNVKNEEDTLNYDVLEDKKVNSYLGSTSVKDNLSLIPIDKMPKLNSLKESDKEIIFEGLIGVISKTLIDKTWEMIISRYKFYEDFYNSRINRK